MNVTECLVRDSPYVSSHTGSASLTDRTNNGSDVILRNLCPFETQNSDHLRTWSNSMMIRDVTH